VALFDTKAKLVRPTNFMLGFCQALFGGFAIPGSGLGEILLGTEAHLVTARKRVLCFGIALLGLVL
jgi:hypothetical protein